ncbi:IAA-amino acid hydrolase ILR1-like protein 4 [Tanacetum coccineum]|uniref:IAA-amino acid hydrolase ILR1-like protein 4 n=1 Tax=Tanacetum coccineum TaxID=301880 RepID=A0ABQ4XV84_9ASTR
MVEWKHKSKVDRKMHACGHDGHVTMLLGAAKILKEHSHLLKISFFLVLVFQPAEEGGGGAKLVVFSRSGTILAGSGIFEAVITKKGGHAAIPQHSIDPILAASNVVVSLQHLVSREADPLDSQVVTVVRLMQLRQRIEEGNATIDFAIDNKPFFPTTINDAGLHNVFQNVAGDVLGVNNVKEMLPLTGEEDFSFYQEVIPGYFYFIGMNNEKNGKPASLHSPFFTLIEMYQLLAHLFFK